MCTMGTYRAQLLVALAEKIIVLRGWSMPLQDLVSQLNPALCGALPEVDLLALMPSSVCV